MCPRLKVFSELFLSMLRTYLQVISGIRDVNWSRKRYGLVTREMQSKFDHPTPEQRFCSTFHAYLGNDSHLRPTDIFAARRTTATKSRSQLLRAPSLDNARKQRDKIESQEISERGWSVLHYDRELCYRVCR